MVLLASFGNSFLHPYISDIASCQRSDANFRANKVKSYFRHGSCLFKSYYEHTSGEGHWKRTKKRKGLQLKFLLQILNCSHFLRHIAPHNRYFLRCQIQPNQRLKSKIQNKTNQQITINDKQKKNK